jgi:hypothetical protein
MNNNEIIKYLDKPVELERLYRSNPKPFHSWLSEAMVEYPESEVLKVWNARLTYSTPTQNPAANNAGLLFVIIISLLSVFLVKLPVFFSIPSDWFYPRFLPLIVFGSLIAYFLSGTTTSIDQKQFIIGCVVICVITMMLMPNQQNSASIIMSQLHMPMVLASLLALSYMANEWKSPFALLRYIRYIGEIIIYTTLILLGGIVLTLLTFGLFRLIGISIEEWYMKYVVIWGLVASPLVATYLYDAVLSRESRLATLIANVFAPLFLMTVVVYLLAMPFVQKNPYSDRDFLITFNGLLIIVWGITVFSISGRSLSSASKIKDAVNISLVSITLIINTIALSAILFRLAEYGVTPNRVAVVGANLLIFVHLVFILVEYIKQLKTMANSDNSEKLIRAVANYLPVYTAWSVFIVVVLPILFNFK